MAIKFKEIRQYISKIARVSICMEDTLAYENYRFIKYVPNSYDEYYLYGIGMIDSEFEDEFYDMHSQDAGLDAEADVAGRSCKLCPCIEIMLSKTRRADIE